MLSSDLTMRLWKIEVFSLITLALIRMASLREVEHKDADGRLSRRLIPVGAGDYESGAGVLVGPPPLGGLKLPLETEVRLNNEFYHRGLLTERDINRRRADAVAALMMVLNVDVDRLLASLHSLEENSATKSS